MVKCWYGIMIRVCLYGFRVKWWNDFFRFTNGVMVNQYFCAYGEMVKSLYNVMVIWQNCHMVNRCFGDTFPSMAKWWKVEIQFSRWSKKFPPGRCPGKYFPRQSTGTIFRSGQHLEKSWEENFPRRCPRIRWHFYSYDDTYMISLYEKLCVRYGMSLYIRSLYVPWNCPDMSWRTLVPSGTF